jgi:type I restriction enzyme, S subunit
MSSAHDRYLAELPEDWPRKELGDICMQIVSGGTPSRSNSAYWGGSVPWVTPGELTHLRTKYLSTTDERITELGLASSGATLVPSESLLVTTRATLGSVALAAMPLATNQGFKTAMFGPDVDASFGYHLFHRLKPELTRRASGTTFLEISGSQFEQVVVPVPALPEQRGIAEILDAVDDAIRSTERIVAKLGQLRQGLLDDLLRFGIDESGELRDPVRYPEQFLATALGPLPRDWDLLPLPRVVRYQNGGTFPSADYRDDGIPLLRPGNLGISEIVSWDRLHTTYLPIHWEVAAPTFVVEGGEVVMNLTAQSLEDGFLGRACITGPDTKCLLNQRIARFISLGISTDFLLWFFRGPVFRSQIDRTATGSKVQHLYNSDLDAVVIPTPSDSEAREIGAILWRAFDRHRSEQDELAKLRALKQGLASDLLAGRVRVTVSDEGTA